MAVLVEAVSVIVRKSSVALKFPGGLEGFRQSVPNATLCEDESLFRVGFMSPADTDDYVGQLEACGLVFLDRGVPRDLLVIDQLRGMPEKCDWAKTVLREIAPGAVVRICTVATDADDDQRVAVPADWVYEQSLYSDGRRVDPSRWASEMEDVGIVDGLHACRDRATGKSLYRGSPFESERKAEFESIRGIADRTLTRAEEAETARNSGNATTAEQALAEVRDTLLPSARSWIGRARYCVGFAHFAHGLALRVLDQYEPAIEEFRRSLEYVPNATNTLLETVLCLGELGRAAEALPVAERAVALDPESPATLGNLASVLFDLDRGEEAWKTIQRALAIEPGNVINRTIADKCARKFGPRA